MDILYVIGQTKTDELRYSLRSIEKNGINVGRIYIAGYCPSYIRKDMVTFIEQPNVLAGYKHNNILNCIRQAVLMSNISTEFLLSSDDHFYVRPTDFNSYPYFCKGTLQETIENQSDKTANYSRSIQHTLSFLKSKRLPTYNFSFHGNTHFNRAKFEAIMPLVEEAMKSEYGVEPSCLMLNSMFADPKYTFRFTERLDLKLGNLQKEIVDTTREVVSMSDYNYQVCGKQWLRKMFPNPCKYEW